MNPLINKIDNDLRRKIYEKTRNGKVHRKTDIKIYKDSEKNKGKSFKEYVEEENKSNKIIIEATKTEDKAIVLKAEKEEDINGIISGTFIDVKK
ncbi:hypothetical protein [Clostridium sp.]|uniref:hypothetical protein n=1 Tax=Clostridium sp. TaxID=1506 RepID=UPI002630E911|nr:hypothetical protein [Clostridium sp.]